MSLMFEPLRKYATFSGRARRLEYWLFQLLMIALFGMLLIWLAGTLPPGLEDATQEQMSAAIADTPAARTPLLLLALAAIAVFLPSLAVSVRRLHDGDRSGWWLLLNLIPIGGLVLFIFYLLDGTRGPNRHGPDPKGRT
jgi:uncharacterized membrane protein YhaH (DUF805 family)